MSAALDALKTKFQAIIDGTPVNDIPDTYVIETLAAIQTIEAQDASASSFDTLSLSSSSGSYSNPSNGNYQFTVPTGKRWQFVGGYVALPTSSTVGDRTLRIGFLTAASNYLMLLEAKATQAASLTYYYNLGLVVQDSTVPTSRILGITVPPMLLDAGEKILININNWQTGDAPVINLKVAEWSA